MEDLLEISNKNVICIFDANGKEYCALTSSDLEDDSIYFARRVNIEGNVYTLAKILDEDIPEVERAYDQKMSFLEELDESDL